MEFLAKLNVIYAVSYFRNHIYFWPKEAIRVLEIKVGHYKKTKVMSISWKSA